MASKTQKTETVRARKRAPNKVNRKDEGKRVRGSLVVLQKLQAENKNTDVTL